MELREDARDVCLDGVVADDELCGDLAVRETARKQAQYFALARRQLRKTRRLFSRSRSPRELLDQSSRNGGCEHRASVGCDADCCDQLVLGRVLQQEAACACAEGLVDVLVEVEGSEDEDTRAAAQGGDPAGGGGWTTIMAGAPFAVAVKIEIRWSEATKMHRLRLELVDSDGNPFEAPTGPDTTEPLVVEQPFQTGIPPGVKPGAPTHYAYTFTALGLPLDPNKRYEFRVSIDGEADDDWTVAFDKVPPAPPFAQAA